MSGARIGVERHAIDATFSLVLRLVDGAEARDGRGDRYIRMTQRRRPNPLTGARATNPEDWPRNGAVLKGTFCIPDAVDATSTRRPRRRHARHRRQDVAPGQ